MNRKYTQLSVALISAGLLFGCGKKEVIETAESCAKFCPADALVYSYFDNGEQLKSSPKFVEFKNAFYEYCEMNDSDRKQADNVLNDLKSITYGVSDISLEPFGVSFGIRLKIDLSEIEKMYVKKMYVDDFEFTEFGEVNGTMLYSKTVEIEDELLSVFVSLPKNGEIFIATDPEYFPQWRADSQKSMATNPEFVELYELREIENPNSFCFIKTEQVFDLVFDAFGMALESEAPADLPFEIKNVLASLRKNLCLSDFGDMIYGWSFSEKKFTSKMKVNPENGLYKQLQTVEPMELPYIPNDVFEAQVMDFNNPQLGIDNLVGAINEIAKIFVPPLFGEPATLAENMLGIKFSEFSEAFNGRVAYWLAPSLDGVSSFRYCFSLGLKDSAKFEEFMKNQSFYADLEIMKDGEINFIDEKLAWVFKNNELVFGSRKYLAESLKKDKPNLFDSPNVKAQLAKADGNFSAISYKNIGASFEYCNYYNFPEEEGDLVAEMVSILFDGVEIIEFESAKDGMFMSRSFY